MYVLFVLDLGVAINFLTISKKNCYFEVIFWDDYRAQVLGKSLLRIPTSLGLRSPGPKTVKLRPGLRDGPRGRASGDLEPSKRSIGRGPVAPHVQ